MNTKSLSQYILNLLVSRKNLIKMAAFAVFLLSFINLAVTKFVVFGLRANELMGLGLVLIGLVWIVFRVLDRDRKNTVNSIGGPRVGWREGLINLAPKKKKKIYFVVISALLASIFNAYFVGFLGESSSGFDYDNIPIWISTALAILFFVLVGISPDEFDEASEKKSSEIGTSNLTLHERAQRLSVTVKRFILGTLLAISALCAGNALYFHEIGYDMEILAVSIGLLFVAHKYLKVNDEQQDIRDD